MKGVTATEGVFDAWNDKKKILDIYRRQVLFKEGDIWWCAVGQNIGEEVYGKGGEFRRPIIILKKLSGNSCIGIPTTTKPRSGSWYHKIHVRGLDRWALLNQIRFFSCNRLWVRESTLPKEQLFELKKSVAKLLGL